jgi:hypothetical protein
LAYKVGGNHKEKGKKNDDTGSRILLHIDKEENLGGKIAAA